MARVAGGEAAPDPPWVAEFLKLLYPSPPPDPANRPLRCIFDLVGSRDQGAAPMWVRPVPLALTTDDDPANWWLMPAVEPPDRAARRTLHAEFESHARDARQDYERLFFLMRKYATTLPNTYGEPGVSLFEQWKMVAALVGISGSTAQPPQALGLVGGDIPGIQRTINTITSKGAAKAMRGRSAFIQLLGQALIERLLHRLDLGLANVVYDAGGNFVLLTGWADGADGTQATVQDVANNVNEVLLDGAGQGRERFDGFHGDLAVALAAVEIPVAALAVPGPTTGLSAWQLAEKLVKDAVAAAKNRPFGDLAQKSDDDWKKLFDPDPAETVDFCAVCRRPKGKGETFSPLEGEGEGRICPECWGFNQLANALGHVGHDTPRLTLSSRPPAEPEAWQRALYAVAERWYAIGGARQQGDIVLALDVDDFPAPGVDGFRLLAHTTPMTGKQIKTNEELAQASTGGLKRLGVLRMDVDNLGDLIVYGLPARTAMQTAELSQALERFFAGWLDRICARVGKGLFYVLFAGGDDLFVVGPWTHMPALAQAIRSDFERYTAGHKAIHLSAGIAVVGEKAPLYAAADESHDALQAAKNLDRDTPQAKNAITFLGQTRHWESFSVVVALQESLVRLREAGLPASLLTTLRVIERRYQQDMANDHRIEEDERDGKTPRGRKRGAWGVLKPKHGPEMQAYYGPWMWRQAYALTRLQNAYPQAKTDLERLSEELLSGRIADLGLAARWAQWLTRKES